MTSFEILVTLHQQAKPLILPNAWDAASARIFEDLGATAIATTSAGVAWAQGYADGNKMPAEVSARVAQSIARIIKVPLTVDFENGYSDDPAVVAENIKPLLDAGVAGINIEDGKDSPALLSEKIAAIKNAVEKHGSKLFINARTDVYLAALVIPTERVNETIKRGMQYVAAGADGLFVPALTDGDEIVEIVNKILLPLNILAMPGLANAAQLGQLGVKRLSAGKGVFSSAWQTASNLAKAFLSDGDSSVFNEDAMSYGKLQQLFTPRS
jgi:2-methylisocitrate lyase-like PEP mutase family enzyme